MVSPPISDRRIGLARLFIVFTVLAWAAYFITWMFQDLLNPLQGRPVARAEAVVYLLVVTLLSTSSLAYLLSRLGFFYRAKSHHRATRAVIDDFFSSASPRLTALIPSYREDARVVRNTLLSVALQEYADLRVVLLIDDPIAPRDQRSRELLDAARALPGEIEELLSWPANRFGEALESFDAGNEREAPLGPAAIARLASEYDAATAWLENLASGQDLVDHSDAFVANHVVRRLARDLATVAGALHQAVDEGSSLQSERARQLYLRLARTFRAELSSFERKRYVSLSHEANKAMNLNSYIGLMGGHYREVQTVAGPALVTADEAEASLHIQEPDYVLTVDADSVLLPEYCLRLVHILEQQEHRHDAIAQTPYSAFPGSATRLERVAGATTDLQHLVHQGLTYYEATFWVGANAVIRKRALDDIAKRSYLGDWEIRTYIKDRTPIEDTDSTIDMGIEGWGLFNVPERLSYSATPPDFGSLCIQRQRWATGGMLIVPKLWARAKACRRRGERMRFAEKFLRWNYMASITWSSISLLILLAFPFNATLITPLLGLVALPYFWAMASDLRYCGYKILDIARVYGFNLVLVPINLAGATATLVQAITASKPVFARTPKVRNRTVTPLIFVVAPYLLVGLAAFTAVVSYQHHAWENMAFAALNLLLVSYAIVAFIGLGHSVVDAFTHLKSFLYRPARPQPRPLWSRRARQLPPLLSDWRAVLDLGTPPDAPGLLFGSGGDDLAFGDSRRSLGPGEFRTLFQPVVDLASGEEVGHEALTRFDDGISAERWLAEAVAAGEGVTLEGKMVRAALRAAAGLPPTGWLAIKASPRLLHSDAQLRFALSGLTRPLLVEFTEPATSDVLPEVRELRSLLPPKALITVENAGFGHKTLTVLFELRPAYLKLARDVLASLAEDGARQAQLANLVRVANQCGCSVVATGVEAEEQWHLLRKLGVPLGQGYLFGRPEPSGLPAEGHAAPAAITVMAHSRTPAAPALAAGAETDGRRRRLSLVRTTAAAAVIAAVVYGGAEEVPSAVAAASASKPVSWFAPYVDATLAPSYSFQDRSLDPARQVVLGFVVSQPGAPCTPSWGGTYGLSQADQALALGPRVAELGQEGVGAVVAFGGRDNTDLAVACTSVPTLERAYQSVISYYNLGTIDFDVEGAALSGPGAAERRAAAVAAVQASAERHHRTLRVWLTLPVEPDGLQPYAISVIGDMLRERVDVAGINVMAMDFTSAPRGGQTMLDLVERAAGATHKQLQVQLERYGVELSARQVWQRMGITVMIGQNDVPGEVFTVADAQGLVRFVGDDGIARISMWSLNRDSECGQAFGESGVLSDTCSGTSEQSLAFSDTFSRLSGVATATVGPAGIIVPAPDNNPANALYPLWSPTAEYQDGYKVVRNGYIYEAKWYNAGEDPAQTWPSSSESPWELLGPVLPTDRAPKLPVLPVGTYPAWSPLTPYEAGQRVLYQGLPYEAKWYNEGSSPGEEAADPFGSPWQPLFTLPGEPAND